MLSPEVWNFKPPKHYVSIEKRNYKDNNVPSIVESHYFNHSVSNESIISNSNFMKVML